MRDGIADGNCGVRGPNHSGDANPDCRACPHARAGRDSHTQADARCRQNLDATPAISFLQGVAEQCANAIGAPAGLARVRIEPPTGDGCVPCNKLPLGYMDRGVPVGEVAQPLADGAWIWLTVEDLLCIYLHDAGEFKPSSVTQW